MDIKQRHATAVLLSGLMAAAGQAMETPETTGAAMTRGELAQALMEFGVEHDCSQ